MEASPKLRLHLWGLALISAGGLLLHLRIHPPGREAFNWVAALWGLVGVVLVPWLLSRSRTAAWGWVLNLLSVVVGTVAMAWFSATHWKGAVTPLTVVLNSTLGDILILWAKVPLAHAALQCHGGSLSPERGLAAPGPYLAALPIPEADEIALPPCDRPATRAILRVVWGLAAALVVGVAAVIGLLGSGTELSALGPLDGGLKVGGQLAGMLAAALLMLQFPLSARLAPLDRAFGLDRLLQLHRVTGAAAAVLAGLHPALLYGSSVYTLGKLRLELWPEVLGAAAVTALGVVAVSSIWRAALRIPYEAWLRLHGVAFGVVALVGVHGWRLGSDVSGGWPQAVWLVMLAGYAGLFVWVKVLRPRLEARTRYEVTQVAPVSAEAWSLTLAPRGGRGLRPHLPGQFAFLTLHREGLATETHPFTISTPPRRDGTVGFTIKQAGDFTATLGRTRPGDRATVQGPWGLFSHLVRPADRLVFIAGGIGITPFLSMLRSMAATGDPRPVTLIWGNRTAADVVLGEELAELSARLAGLRVVHVLSEANEGECEAGFVDEALLRRVLSEAELRAEVYLCGPPPMMELVKRSLRRLGVPGSRVHWERFAL